MKYTIGNRYRYFSIVGKKAGNLECLCDCGNLFDFPIKHIGRKINQSCHSNKRCSIWVNGLVTEKDWPDNSYNRRVDFNAAIGPTGNFYKTCKTCGDRKYKGFFSYDMQHTCLYCLGGMSVYEFKRGEGKRSRDKSKEIISIVIGSAKDKDGYIYLMYSPSLNVYKVGVSNSPYSRLISVRHDYGIEDLILICIGNPVGRSFKCESYIHSKIVTYKRKHIKPCGGVANELFSCDLSTVSNMFLSVCQEYTWIDEGTRDLILY